MLTECNPGLFDFGSVEGRRVVAAFDGGRATSDAGALLLGATDKAIGLVERLAGCFCDDRRAELAEHSLPALIGQRVFRHRPRLRGLGRSRRVALRSGAGGVVWEAGGAPR